MLALLLLLVSSPATAEVPTGFEIAPEVAEQVTAALDAAPFSDMIVGVHVVAVDDGEVLVSWQPDRPLVPASTMKVLTSAAALSVLGPAHQFPTDVYATAPLVDGVIEGDLVIVGHGDPTYTEEKVWRLLRDLQTDGLVRVTGDVLLDDTYFDEDPLIPGWDSAHDLAEGPSYFAGIGAIPLGFGSTAVSIRPGAEVGAPAVVVPETPSGDYLRIDAAVTTGAGRRDRVEVTRTVAPDHMALTLRGEVGIDGGTVSLRRAVADPTRYAAGVFGALIRDVGIVVGGEVKPGRRPDGAERLRRQYSPPLASVLMDTNKYSSNFMAETVLRVLGAEVHGEGTTDAGLKVVRAYLDGLGIAPADWSAANGSGLSRRTQLSAHQLTTVLVAAARDPAVAPELTASLAIGGLDGTLRSRFREMPRRVRGKTGTLAGVHSLAGFTVDPQGRVLAFAFVANEVRGGLSRAKRAMDGVLEALMVPSAADEGDAP